LVWRGDRAQDKSILFVFTLQSANGVHGFPLVGPWLRKQVPALLIVKKPTFSDDGEALVGALSTNRVPTGFRVLAKMDVTSHICL
jgi:hypothetical protein